MLYQAQATMSTEPWLAFFPGLLIFATTLSVNMLGDGLAGRKHNRSASREELQSWQPGCSSRVPRCSSLRSHLSRPAASSISRARRMRIQRGVQGRDAHVEKLTELFLARIEAFDRRGPSLRALIGVNPKARETGRALDTERKVKGPRSPLHGIPVVLKDNFDTVDMPTTGGLVLLEGSIHRTMLRGREAAGGGRRDRRQGQPVGVRVGGAYSSLGGETLNPHDLTEARRGPRGDPASPSRLLRGGRPRHRHGGSVRGPSTANGVVGLKPTLGLFSRDGIIRWR